MATILYLDVDDEITSAAARIRSATETKVALVLPPGSRLATSRINFRLLAREGLERNRVLSIIAADNAARAIAASAGLPVYTSVAEFEEAIAPPPAEPAEPPSTGAHAGPSSDVASEPPITPPGARGGRRRSPARGAAKGAGGGAEGGLAGDGIARAAGAEQLSAELVTAGMPVAPTRPTPPPIPRPPATPAPSGQAVPPTPASETRARSSGATIPVISAPRTRPGFSGRLLITAGAVVVTVLVLAVAAYTVLPAATVVVTPVPVPFGPIEFIVRADPDATGVDPVGGVIPATRLTKDLTSSGEFKATGKRVVQKKATGQVTFTSENTFVPVTIPAGTSVRTGTGVAFVTTAEITLPKASFATGPTRKTISVVAVKAGPAGNVDPGTILVVPTDINNLLAGGGVTNGQATSGGSRQEFTKIQQADIDAAIASLTKDLGAQFDTWATSPDALPEGSTVFPATGKLGTVVPSVDPSTLIDVEQATFQLAATATATVVAVDPTLVDQVAATRIAASVPVDHTMQEGSVTSSHDGGQADGELVDFRVTASASAIPVLDPVALREAIKGKPVGEARTILGRYGTVTIDTWPGFVGSIPTLDARLDLTVAGAQPAGSPSPVPSGSAP
jgi:Baseplate J-like protein